MTKIEWTDKSLNHIAGCTKKSEGCLNCYSEKMSVRQAGMEKKRIREGRNDIEPHYANVITAGRFNNHIHVRADWDRLMKPLQWKKPKMIFVNSMADTFHPDVPDEYIDSLWLMMALCSSIQRYKNDNMDEPVGEPHGHCFQILTKRPERMQKYLTERCLSEIIQDATDKLFGEGMGEWEDWVHWNIENHKVLPNVWLGVSVENQKTADERIPWLLKTPASVRFISAEPLLEYINFINLKGKKDSNTLSIDATIGKVIHNDFTFTSEKINKLDQIIVGGESGSNARPMHPDWVRSIRDQCEKAGIAFFFKQWGAWCPGKATGEDCEHFKNSYRFPNGEIVSLPRYGNHECYQWKTGEFKKWATGELVSFKTGKKKAGNVLDGKIYEEYPEIWRPK
ncbi:MAG: phage Gp37/Gp68 family protein [Candidatus Marinimicrobia bacterium]|nr:phage Gp37/Gp68 family protein [Candidatus Neomarinimicrobiota bacterium]